MTTNRNQSQKKVGPTPKNPHLTPTEFRAIAFVLTLLLAAMAIALDVKEPVVWTFLGTALGLALGNSSK